MAQGFSRLLRIARAWPPAAGRHGDLTDSFVLSSTGPILNEGRVVRTALKEVPHAYEVTGRDAPVIEYLSQQESVHQFLAGVMSLVDSSVSAYQRRGFKNLMVSFGCTGGQHRSVYLAEQLAKHLRATGDVEVVVRHLQLEKLGLEMPALEMPGQ